METQLLPCPHCGGEAIAFDFDTDLDGWAVVCNNSKTNCGARMVSYNSKEEATAAWNRRTPPASARTQGDAIQPDWANAPEWANFWAIDPDGTAKWFDTEPRMFSPLGWVGDHITAVDRFAQIPWQKSLQPRPTT